MILIKILTGRLKKKGGGELNNLFLLLVYSNSRACETVNKAFKSLVGYICLYIRLSYKF